MWVEVGSATVGWGRLGGLGLSATGVCLLAISGERGLGVVVVGSVVLASRVWSLVVDDLGRVVFGRGHVSV